MHEFDSSGIAKDLNRANFNDQWAEVLLKAVRAARSRDTGHLASKSDPVKLRGEMQTEFANRKREIEETEYRLIE
jgi:hypothetical protein